MKMPVTVPIVVGLIADGFAVAGSLPAGGRGLASARSRGGFGDAGGLPVEVDQAQADEICNLASERRLAQEAGSVSERHPGGPGKGGVGLAVRLGRPALQLRARGKVDPFLGASTFEFSSIASAAAGVDQELDFLCRQQREEHLGLTPWGEREQ
jgi:hypothetical protein